jgi:hypothetical protein
VHHEIALISTIAVGLVYALIGGYARLAQQTIARQPIFSSTSKRFRRAAIADRISRP